MPATKNLTEELQTVTALQQELTKKEYQNLENEIRTAEAELESAEGGFEKAQEAYGNNVTPQTQAAAVKAQQLLQTKQNALKKLQQHQATKKAMEEKLQSLMNQYGAVARLEALHGNLSITLDTNKPIDEEKFQKLVKVWQEKAKDDDVSKVTFSREPFSVSTWRKSAESAKAVAATAMLMANDYGVRSFSIKEGTPSQRQTVAQELLRAGYSKVTLSSDTNKHLRFKSSIASDKIWNTIFETKKTLEAEGKAKDDFAALYEALGKKVETKYYKPELLQKTLIQALTPAQFAKMLETTKDASNKPKMIEQLAETLKDKDATQFKEYFEAMQPGQNYSLYEAFGKKEDLRALQKTLIQALTPKQFIVMLEEANAVEQEKMLGQLAETLKGKAGPEWKKYLDEMDTPQQEMFAGKAAQQLNEQFVPAGKQSWYQQATAKAKASVINSIKEVFMDKDAHDSVKGKFNNTLDPKLKPQPAQEDDIALDPIVAPH